jgi:TatA/E family protein of Tat protein translocase
MPNIGPVELVIILVIALLVIGPGKLPDVGSALGKSIREFRKAASDVQESVKLDAPVAPVVPAPVAAAVPAPVAAPAPVAPPTPAAAVPSVPVPNTLAAPATLNELGAPAASDPAATAAEAATEARV